jgi:formylglycine-generating enzyme required for sulfatase activity
MMKIEVTPRTRGKIIAFGRKFSAAHVAFACHAALPLALTPELLYRLRLNFQKDISGNPLQIPWIAVSDLLLSSLCEEVGYELYEMEPAVRQALLTQLTEDPRFTLQRQREVASFLWEYVRHDLNSSDSYQRDFAESQSWAATAYQDSRKSVEYLAAAFNRAYQENPADLMRLATLTEMLHQPIPEFDKLRILARAMGHYLHQQTKRDQEDKLELRDLAINGKTVTLGSGLTITLPPEVARWFWFIRLPTFEFNTALVDETGQVISRPPGQAKFFPEPLTPDLNLEMVYIPGGKFMMGDDERDSEKPIHEVTIQPFYLGKYAVTQEQYEAVMGKNPCGFKGAKRPVEIMSWHDAVEFCQKLSKKTGKEYRLPREAEWEYACRAGTTTPFHFGATITPDLVNYDGNYPYGKPVMRLYTIPTREEITEVGTFPPNAFGLYDMHGNVWEWCSDRWHENYEQAPPDGSSWEIGTDDKRVQRGGSWYKDAVDCRSANRGRNSAGAFFRDYGFRVALVLPPVLSLP